SLSPHPGNAAKHKPSAAKTKAVAPTSRTIGPPKVKVMVSLAVGNLGDVVPLLADLAGYLAGEVLVRGHGSDRHETHEDDVLDDIRPAGVFQKAFHGRAFCKACSECPHRGARGKSKELCARIAGSEEIQGVVLRPTDPFATFTS